MGIHGPLAAGRVNINTASIDTLRDDVKGIGQVLAERIVAYREANGPFRSVSELERVQGVGSAMLSRLADQLTVGDQAGDAEQVDLAGSGTAGPTIPLAERVPHLPQVAGEPMIVAHVERPSTGPEEDEDMVDAEDVRPVPEEDEEAPETVEGSVESAGEQLLPVEEEELSSAELEAATGSGEEQLEVTVEAEPSEEVEPETPEAVAEATVAETELLPVENDAWPEEELPLAEEAEPALAEDGGTPVTPEGEMAFVVAEEEAEKVSALEEAPPLAEEEPFDVLEPEPALAAAVVEAAAPEATVEQSPPATGPRADAYRPGETRTAPVVTETARASRGSFWHDLGLVVLGGVLGLVLTLAVFALLSGTVDYATRREFDALSRNADIMQSNFQVAWDRVSNLEQRADTMQNELVPLAPVPGRMDVLERSVTQAQDTLDAVQSDVQALTTQAQALQSSMATMEQQVGVLTEDVAVLRTSLDEMQSAFDAVQERVTKFDAFFVALRDLLVDLSPVESATAPEAEAVSTAETAETAQPEEAATPSPTPAG